MIIEDLSKDGTKLEVTKMELFNCVFLGIQEDKKEVGMSIFLGKKEVQELINKLEGLKKDIL